MKKLIPTALIAVLLLFMVYAGYRYYTEEMKPIEDLKKDMAEQRELFDSIRPEAMPVDFSIMPETAPPLPTDSFDSLEELIQIYGTETNSIPETIETAEILQESYFVPENEDIPEVEIEPAPDFTDEIIPEDAVTFENVEPEIQPETEPDTILSDEEFSQESPLQEVKEVNRDGIAWLTIPDTDLDYPIAQGEDNDFYLWRGFNGLRNGTGTPFLDYRCKPDFSGYNSIIYGHNMEQMLMFATIRLYRDKAFMEEHPEGWLLLDDGLHRIQFFAFLSVQSDSAIYQTAFASPQEFEEYKELMFELASYTMDVPEEINHVIMLSTCTFERENQRGILVGKLT